MRGDFSRIRFNPAKNYTSVLEQQGRVALDADANEQRYIDAHLRKTEIVDVIGDYGAPKGDDGFAISIRDGRLLFSAGRYYVNGVLCEAMDDGDFDNQPFLIHASNTAQQLLEMLLQGQGNASLRVWLEVWERLVTAREDSCLLEPALGQAAETTARRQTVWRVVAEPGTVEFANSTCCSGMYRDLLEPPSPKMAAQTNPASDACGCDPVASSGYVGLENQLYRVEVHQGGGLSNATFKWSRENGSVVASVVSMQGADVRVDSLGPDSNLGFAPDQWVEIFDDSTLFGEQPNGAGMLYQVKSIESSTRTLTMFTTVLPVDTSKNARVRRWDQSGTSASSSGLPLGSGGWVALENGIEVSFQQGIYRTGDAWTIPARAATGAIEWPPCGSGGDLYQPAQRVRILRAPLACITADPVGVFTNGQGIPFAIADCRRLFPPLTDLDTANPALHVTGISWVNDSVMSLDELAGKGLVVNLDGAPTSPVSSAIFTVTMENVLDIDQKPQELTNIRQPFILDGAVTRSGTSLQWQISQDARMLSFLNSLLTGQARLRASARVRVRLYGNRIFAAAAGSTLYLDGGTFARTSVQADGTEHVDLQLPSGSHVAAADFESWFYLTPTLTLLSVTPNSFSYSLLVSPNNTVLAVQTTVNPGVPPQNISPLVELVLSVAAPAGGAEVVVSLAGNPEVASLAATSVVVPAGSTTAQVGIVVKRNPGATTLSFTVSAALRSAPNAPVSATFTITGMQPQIIIG
ncbi:DUF6519 domain-containing protein [Terriglobus roseus]|uniref:Uncharacterized protein n=1 Tax=Terriglobus roseus TaxID=392734 RepID=A0A1H4IX91_9BACT|nr:DUF6519 domain-containing protein [Terriglobus roseus]SEB38689.1 hypothetical protein SAMN05443244_0174 [Terriglobus roseus]